MLATYATIFDAAAAVSPLLLHDAADAPRHATRRCAIRCHYATCRDMFSPALLICLRRLATPTAYAIDYAATLRYRYSATVTLDTLMPFTLRCRQRRYVPPAP